MCAVAPPATHSMAHPTRTSEPLAQAACRGLARASHAHAGFTYLLLLWWVVLAGIVLAALGVSWNLVQRRERESEWLFRGQQYSAALGAYRDANASGLLPQTIDQLLSDDRGPVTLHHLRRAYNDPITRGPWALKTVDGRITGVYSDSDQAPLRAVLGYKHYRDLVFIPAVASASSASGAASAADAASAAASAG